MADLIGGEDKEKSLYLVQIQYLDKQLERCQLQCDDLVHQKKVVTSLCVRLEEDKEDITEYLTGCLAAEEKKMEELAERLDRQQQEARRDHEALKLQHGRQLQEIQDWVGELDSETKMLAATVEEHQVAEEKLMVLMKQQSEVESLKRRLVCQEEEHQAAVEVLKSESDPQSSLDGRWSDVETKASGVIEEERARLRQLQDQVQVLQDHSLGLLKERDHLRHQVEVVGTEVDIMKTSVDEVSQKSCTRKKESEQLMEKCQQLKDGSTTHQRLQVENEALRQRLVSARQDGRQRAAELDQLRTRLQEEASRRRRLEEVIRAAAITLTHIQTDSEEKSKTQSRMLKLLEVLESTAAPPASGSTPEETSRGPEPRTTDPEPARAQTLDLETDPLFLLACYIPGDLGLVPRPTWKHRPAASRTGGRSAWPPLSRSAMK